MTDKEFYDNQNKTVNQIRLAVDHYKERVIDPEMAIDKINELLEDMDKHIQRIVKGERNVKKD